MSYSQEVVTKCKSLYLCEHNLSKVAKELGMDRGTVARFVKTRNLETTKEINIDDLQYMAGFYDGEGYITLMESRPSKTRKNASFSVFLSVSNTHFDTMKWLQDAIGGKLYCKKAENDSSRKLDLYILEHFGDEAVSVLKSIFPYLRVKKDQALVIFEFQKVKLAKMSSSFSENEATSVRKFTEKLKNLKRFK